MSYKSKIKRAVKKYLKQFGLHQWKMTRLYVDIPKSIKKELHQTYTDAASGFYACTYVTGVNTFVLAVSLDIPEDKTENVVAHEISHILLSKMWNQLTEGKRYDAKNELEVVCNRIAKAATYESEN